MKTIPHSSIERPTGAWEQKAWTEWLAARLGISINEARKKMAAAEADLADAGRADATYEDIAQLAADRGI